MAGYMDHILLKIFTNLAPISITILVLLVYSISISISVNTIMCDCHSVCQAGDRP